MNRLVLLGLLAFALGIGAMVTPGIVPIPLDRVLVYLVGAAALVQAYRVTAARRRSTVRRSATPDPEVTTPSPVPGTDLYEAIRDFTGGRGYYSRDGLRDAAVAVLTRYDGDTPAGARARLADGTWTDDPSAAAFLGDEDAAGSLGERVLGRLGSDWRYREQRRRTIAVIARRAGVDDDGLLDGRRPGFTFPFGDRIREDVPTDGDEPSRHDTGNWRGVSAVALLAIGTGVLAGAAPVVLSGVVGVGVAAYARAASPPELDLIVTREIDEDRPDGGDAVEVTLDVRNEGNRTVPDLRIVDGVPPTLSVVDGSPRLGTTLRPGEVATLSYVVEARRGDHAFEPVTAIARDVAGVYEACRRIPVETSLSCVPPLRPTVVPVPLRTAATRFTGSVQTPSGGEGVEFFATRAYRPGDPTNRIDWNRRARTGELATVEYREERAASVVVVLDARRECFLAPRPHAPHAVDRSVDAAGSVVASLLSEGDRVGIAAFGSDCWLPPGSGRDHRTRVRELLATDPALTSVGPREPEPSEWRQRLERRLPADTQLLIFSPLCDVRAPRQVRRFDATGHPATVISPDPTVGDAPGPMLARVARRVRIADLRRAGIPVIDWSAEESIDVAFARHNGRWSR